MLEEYSCTEYFEFEVLRKRPYLTLEMCVKVVKSPLRIEVQNNERVRFWGHVKELNNRVIRVVTLGDRKTIHNAFLDRGFIE